MSRMREQGWIRSLVTVEAPAVRLVCFPHSGGSASAFADWATALPPEVELVAVQYPGRGDRFVEQLVDDVAEMASHAVAELLRLPTCDDVLFGHSLGALVAYESALLLRDMGEQPRMLCASACLPPGHMKNREVHAAPDDEFWATLYALGGIDPGIAENEELRELLLPTLRSDLRAHATYRPCSGTKPLSCPVSCYHGVGDPMVDEALLGEWADVTSGEFRLRVRPGGHFHVGTDIAGLVSDILGRETA
ncbi:thioesterase II family protein [Streptomyces coffeae]|uniref:Thioesterase n=1 Tax=Streptomyces coffeae TaxID=621382 RepID=A0ABS1ND83_9ACTN|nr:alpha/beta fold hydrolase [Streptomyces coffeae]MBL1097912.1 thioesterase [Streptomyces coffeae]